MTSPTDKVRSAGTRDPDRLAAGLDSAGIVDAVKTTRELDSTTRVYVRQWLIVGRYPSAEAAQGLLTRRFHERLLPSDMHVAEDGDDGSHLALARLWTVAGEFRHAAAANQMHDEIASGKSLVWPPYALRTAFDALSGDTPTPLTDDQVRVVVLNSRPEQELKNVGVVKLPQRILEGAKPA